MWSLARGPLCNHNDQQRFAIISADPDDIWKNFTQPTNDRSQDVILHWTAAWLNQVEFLQCKWNVCKTDADIYFIIEAGAAVEYYPTNGYIINILKRSRQIASSILIGFKFNIIVSNFTIIHEMGQEDKLAAVWKYHQTFNGVNLYSPP